MTKFEINALNGLFYIHHQPADEEGLTYVFFNALTGDTSMWETTIAPELRKAGHGTLSFNFRGQANSPFSPETDLDSDLIVADSCKLIDSVSPRRVVLCGLSIGGLFAVRSWMAGFSNTEVAGIILINTLRTESTRLQWINDALVQCAEVGGLELFRDLYVPLLFNQKWQKINRDNFLQSKEYTPLPKDSGHYNLLKNAGSADWDLPYEKIDLPVLVMTGLQDRVFLDMDDVELLYSRLPNARHVQFEDAGHMIPAERPNALTRELKEFAAEVSA